MSDPAKSPAEIEDVLSSIRRLVSEHQTAPAERAAAPAAPAPSDDKLVLTASFRVSDPDDPWVPVRSSTEEPHVSDSDPATGDAAAFQPDDRLADWGHVADAAPGEPSAAIENAEDTALDTDAETSGPDDGKAGLGSEDAAPDADTDAHGPDDMAAMDAADPASIRDYEPESGDDDWPGPGGDDALRHLVAARTIHVDARPRPVAEAGADPVQDRAVPEHDDIDLSHGGTDARFDSDDVDDLGDDPSPFTFPDSDEGILDEDTLRDMIVDIVREELQGVLGQRITRNVRKMVRREIRIALAAEDLE